MADETPNPDVNLPDRPAASGGLNFASSNPAAGGGDASGFVASGASPSFDEAAARRRPSTPRADVTFEGESARRQAEAGGAASFAEESDARNDRAGPSRSFGQTGPDSLDRDRTGRISVDEGRALERAAGGTSKSSFDSGKIQASLARLGRVFGGQKEVDRQLDTAFGSGAAQRIRPEPVAVDGSRSQPEAFDATGAIDDSVDPGIVSDPRGSIVGLPGFSI